MLALAWRQVLGALLLLAIVVQGTIVQTHIDYARPAAASATGAPQLGKMGLYGPADGSSLCPWCQEAAMAGHFFLPTATALPPVPVSFQWLAPATVVAFGLASPGHGWLSRAPPR